MDSLRSLVLSLREVPYLPAYRGLSDLALVPWFGAILLLNITRPSEGSIMGFLGSSQMS